jgi:L-fucose isomerase-like protein
MLLIKKYLGVSSFQANPSQIFVEENDIILAHCTIPCDMCKSISTDTHFESGIGIGVKGELYKKEISIFKINSKLDQYVLLKGSILNNLNYKNLCRTQVKIKLNKESDASYFLKRPLGNHHIIFYGNKTKELEKQLIKLKRIF